jgi:hypothetical protein
MVDIGDSQTAYLHHSILHHSIGHARNRQTLHGRFDLLLECSKPCICHQPAPSAYLQQIFWM